MIIVRRVVKRKTNASFGFPNPFERFTEVNRGVKYNQKELQKALNQAKSQGKNLRDPKVLVSVMKPVSQKVGKHPGGSVFTRRRKTKKGKTIVEQVRR